MRILTNLRENSETLDISLKSDFNQIKENLERVLPSDNLMLIEKMVIEVDQSEDLLFKSKRLLEISNILAELVYCLDEFPSDYEDSGSMFKLSKFLTERTKTYSEIYQAFQLISDAETNENLSSAEQFKKYASGFELLAMVLESKSEFISPEFLKTIELTADMALDVELEARKEYSNNKELAELGRSMRRSVMSILWMIEKLESLKTIEGFRSLKNSFAPFIKHMGGSNKEQIEKNKKGIAWIRNMIEEGKNIKTTQEEIDEYNEIQEILKRDK